MRKILDACNIPNCTGRLFPRAPVRDRWHPSEQWRETVFGPPHETPLRDRETVLHYLACSVCGTHCEAVEAGFTLEEIRQKLYRAKPLTIPELTSVPDTCPKCAHDGVFQEYITGPYGWPPEYRTLKELEDPREHLIAVYCGRCNTIHGTLPPDPTQIQTYDSIMKKISDAIRESQQKDGTTNARDDDDQGPLPH